MIQHPGNVFVVSAPSGAGKSTLAQRLVRSVPDLIFSISFTTRKPRPGEVDGQDYFFIDDDRFDAMVREGGFVEWVQVYGHRYGTGRDWLGDTLATGRDFLDVSPMRGVIRGGAQHILDVAVTVEPLAATDALSAGTATAD